MPLSNYMNRLQSIGQPIRLKAPGTPKELAEKFKVSERQLYNYVKSLKELDAEIEFSCNFQSYIYLENVELKIKLELKNP